MAQQKTPAELHRQRLASRARKALIEAGKKIGKLTPSQKISPSQRKSESARKKDARRAGVKIVLKHYPCDCHGCPNEPCGISLEQCNHKSMVHRCKKCGQLVRHRVVPGDPWELCPPCKVEMRL